MPLTTDPNDRRLGHGGDTEPGPQNEAYLVLSEEERGKGFIRPVRQTYKHVGASGPQYPLADLTDEQKAMWGDNFDKFEVYPEGSKATGRYWTQEELDKVGKGCNSETTMNIAIAETFARSPHFYGATYCVHCRMHLPIDEFVWVPDGTRLGS